MPSQKKSFYFADIIRHEREGKDFSVSVVERHSPTVIVAPHGGWIEPGTSELAHALAGEAFSFYAFEGTKPANNYRALHLPSTRFDEPRCIQLLKRSLLVLTVHGCDIPGQIVWVGGRHKLLRARIVEAMKRMAIRTEEGARGKGGMHKKNICNRGILEKGVQMEISSDLRQRFVGEPLLLADFAAAVRHVLFEETKKFDSSPMSIWKRMDLA